MGGFLYITIMVLIMGLSLVYVLHKIYKTNEDVFEDNDDLTGKLTVGTWIPLACLITYTVMVNDLDKDNTGAVLFGTFVFWLVSVLVNLIVLHSIFKNYSDYKSGCLALGFELKDHVGKFLVTTRKITHGSNRGNYQLTIKVILSTHSILGNYARTSHVEDYCVLKPENCTRKVIEEKAKAYFGSRKDYRHTYLVEGDSYLKQDNPSEDIIVINLGEK